MDPRHYRLSTCCREASRLLLEASEYASDLKRFQLDRQLLEQGLDLCKLADELLEQLPPRLTALQSRAEYVNRARAPW